MERNLNKIQYGSLAMEVKVYIVPDILRNVKYLPLSPNRSHRCACEGSKVSSQLIYLSKG